VSVVLIEKNEKFESYKMNLKKGAIYTAKPHFPGSKEKIYVLNGSVNVGDVEEPKEANEGDIVEFDADSIHLYKAKSSATLIVTIYYPKKRYFSEDIFVDVFDKKVYEELNSIVKAGVEVVRVIAKVDNFDGENVTKNENGIFVYKKRNLKFYEIKEYKNDGIYHFLPFFSTVKEMDKSIILHFTAFREEFVFERYLALMGEINLAKNLLLKSGFNELIEALERKKNLTHLNNFLEKNSVKVKKLATTYKDGGIYEVKFER